MSRLNYMYEALPGHFGEQGKGHLFQGNKGQILRGTKTILGNWKHKKKIDFWGIEEQAILFQGNK